MERSEGVPVHLHRAGILKDGKANIAPWFQQNLKDSRTAVEFGKAR